MKQFQRPVYKRTTKTTSRRGTVFAILDDEGTLSVGWSLCNVKSGDTYCQEYGTRLARDRAEQPAAKSLRVAAGQPATTPQLLFGGVPQTVLGVMGKLIDGVRMGNNVYEVVIHTPKSIPSFSTPAWSATPLAIPTPKK
jgi:hypothetical protein